MTSCPGWFEHRDPSLRGRCPSLGRSTVQGSAWALSLIRGSLHTLESKREAEELQKSLVGRAGQHEDAGIATRGRPMGQVGVRTWCNAVGQHDFPYLRGISDGMQWAGGMCAGHTFDLSSVPQQAEGKPYPWGHPPAGSQRTRTARGKYDLVYCNPTLLTIPAK